MIPVKKPVSRRIVVCEVGRQFVVIRNAGGYPNGFAMQWRGRTAWCQPYLFVSQEGLYSAVRHRLELSGLVATTIKEESGRYSDEFKVIAQVELIRH
jgi:hypothetical protein